MYKKPIYAKTTMSLDNTFVGETIEIKVKRLTTNKEPIKDAAPIIFTEKSQGVNAAYNIRTDRWEVAVDALTRLEKSKTAKRDELNKAKEAEKTASEAKEGKIIEGNFGITEPTQGKANQ